jgi:DNA/RNA-binding domain of Phe-tRNA-synthetase-like protein
MNVGVYVSPEVSERWPAYEAAVVIAEGVGNGPSDARSKQLLAAAELAARESELERAAADPRVAAWRTVFSEFGSKPSRYPCSAEALLARVLKGDALPRINALVDTYNAVSLRHVIPVGGEDLDELRGDLRLVRADDGEVVWRDDAGVTCRRWNWRQEPRTRLTEATTRAFFVVDALAPQRPDAAVDELIGHLRERSPDARVRVERPTSAPS